jgi:hypothetical protein
MGRAEAFSEANVRVAPFSFKIFSAPRTKHDDLIDAFSNILEVMSPSDHIEKDEWEGSKLSPNEIAIWKEKDEMAKPRYIKRTKMRW